MLFAILHNIRSLHNVGSIFRTADAVGVSKLYLCGMTGTPPRKEIAKVALGAEQHVPWEYVRRTGDAIRWLKKEGIAIVALEQARGSVLYTQYTRKENIALLLGDEVRGVSPSLLGKADVIISIPMRGAKESLNVSVAFGIAAYHFA